VRNQGTGIPVLTNAEAECDWPLATGDWRLATGDWRLATGDWRLATGDWRLATGAGYRGSRANVSGPAELRESNSIM